MSTETNEPTAQQAADIWQARYDDWRLVGRSPSAYGLACDLADLLDWEVGDPTIDEVADFIFDRQCYGDDLLDIAVAVFERWT